MAKRTSEAALATLPTSDQITLLLKNDKHTVLLSVYPSQSFLEIKALLLAALRSRNISSIGGSSVPEDPEQVEFGVLIDRKDPAKGWVPLAVREQELANSKGGKRKVGGSTSISNENPEGAGLTDGSWVAFRTKTMDETTQQEDEDDMDLEADPGWNVIVPAYEDEEEV